MKRIFVKPVFFPVETEAETRNKLLKMSHAYNMSRNELINAMIEKAIIEFDNDQAEDNTLKNFIDKNR